MERSSREVVLACGRRRRHTAKIMENTQLTASPIPVKAPGERVLGGAKEDPLKLLGLAAPGLLGAGVLVLVQVFRRYLYLESVCPLTGPAHVAKFCSVCV